MKRILAAAVLAMLPLAAEAKLQVVTTTSDLAALAREVGGDAVSVEAIAKGYQDPHFVEAKPSYLLKLKRADLFVEVGLELEVAWAPALLTNARNAKILPGQPGFLDASEVADILEKPTGQVDRSLGDVHPFGNPHYWLDPENGRRVARRLAARLKELEPVEAALFDANLKGFEARLDRKESEWRSAAAGLQGLKVVTYHNSWPNFMKYFGLEVVDFVEPRPGIPPSPAHVQSLIARMRREKVPLLLIEPYFDEKLPARIAGETGGRLVILPPSVGAEPGLASYFDLFDHDLALLAKALGLGREPR